MAIIYISTLDIYRKVSYTKLGCDRIESEYQGIHWYSSCTSEHFNYLKKYWYYQNYSRIDLFKIHGKQIDYNLKLSKSQYYLNLCIDHYLDIWPSEKKASCHGDLTLDNVIFSPQGAVFFDWEHFYDKGEVWGFDIAYLIMSAAFFPNYKSGALDKDDCKALKSLWDRLRKNGLGGDLSKYPMDYFFDVFNNGLHWKGIVDRSPKKLFPVWSSEKFNEYLHKVINE